MRTSKKIIGLFTLILVLSLMTSCRNGQSTQEDADRHDQNQAETKEPIDVNRREITDTAFVDSILDQLPATYIVSEGEYFESLGGEPLEATVVSPCDAPENAEAINDPLCFTTLTIVETEENTDSLEQYIQNSDLDSYEERVDAALVEGVYRDEVPYAYTPEPFMCLGTGAETCMRKQFVYHLEDGRNILVEMRYWDYEDGEVVEKPIKDVQEVVEVYEEVLIQ